MKNKKQIGKKAYQQGIISEIIARLFLTCKGYKCLSTRTKTPLGEIDILCQKSGQMIIIEVKSAPNILKSHDSYIPKKQYERILKAGNYLYQKQHKNFPNGLRFDAIFIDPTAWKIKHHRNISQ